MGTGFAWPRYAFVNAAAAAPRYGDGINGAYGRTDAQTPRKQKAEAGGARTGTPAVTIRNMLAGGTGEDGHKTDPVQ